MSLKSNILSCEPKLQKYGTLFDFGVKFLISPKELRCTIGRSIMMLLLTQMLNIFHENKSFVCFMIKVEKE